VVDGKLHVQTEPESAAGINRALVRADVDVTGLRQEARTLEEVFLQMTGPGAEVDAPPPEEPPSRRRRGFRLAPGR
jgi:ABC-2 type transport system ATP-binding protein